MNKGQSSLALREIRAHLTAPQVLAVLAGVSVVLSLSGPFRTLDLLGPVLRTTYWVAVVFGTYATGTLVTTLVMTRPRVAALPAAARIVIGGIAVALILTCLDFVILQQAARIRAEAVQNLIVAILISTVLLAVREVMVRTQPISPVGALARPPVILDRLPLANRGNLLSLSVQDHYVRIVTTKGAGMVLMRLADAIRETGDVPGLQVHRSHWVAQSAILAVRKTGETAVLTLLDGSAIPVSRRYVNDLRTRGLLPARPATGAHT